MILTIVFAIIGILLGLGLLISQFIPLVWSLVVTSLVMPQIITRTVTLVLAIALITAGVLMLLKYDLGRLIANAALSILSLIVLYAAFSWIGIFDFNLSQIMVFGVLYFVLVLQIILINGLKQVRNYLKPVV